MACSPSGYISRDKGWDSLPVHYDTKFYKLSQEAPVLIRTPSITPPMSLIPLDKLIQSLIDPNVPYSIFENLEIVPSGRLHMPFLIKNPDGNHMALSLPPPADMRLLRSERSSIRSEAAVLQWLSEFAVENRKTGVKVLGYRDQHTSSGEKVRDTRLSGQRPVRSLLDYAPRLTKHGAVNVGGHTLYNLSTPSLGVAISTLPRPLSLEERRSVDFQSGQLLRRASLYRSPNRRFGLAVDVLSQIIQRPQQLDSSQIRGYAPVTNVGSSCWSEAFHILLESALRDAEDFTITISYHGIRHHFKRFRHFLDCVTRSCLVVVNIGEDLNTLVQRYEGKSESTNDNPGNNEQDDKKSSGSTGPHGRIDISGLREWSHCIFGDPLIASAFGQNSSSDFLHGFHSPLQEAEPGIPDYPLSPVEDREYAHVRLLLYECYHTVVTIVKEFCRPQDDSFEREMAGRKKLVGVLSRLEDLDDQGNPKRKRPSMEMIPAKRPRSEVY